MSATLPTVRWILAAALACTTSCVVYNQECSPIVTDPDEVTGFLGGDVRTIKAEVRTKDNAFGQLVGEAYFHAFDTKDARLRPDIGFENSGSIRSEGVCEIRDPVRKGPVKRKVLREVLPFDDQVAVVSVTHHQLKGILEHAVSGLSVAGNATPPGAFLQLYGATVSADCNLQGETLKNDGTRDKEGLRIKSIVLQKRDGTTLDLPLNPPSDTDTVRIAVNSYMLAGGDNFVDFKSVSPNATDTLSAGGFNFEIIAQYFKATYADGHPLPAQPTAHWLLTDCH